METSSAVLCTHTVQQNCSPTLKQFLQGWAWAAGGPQRGQFTASPATRWGGPLSRVLLPFPCFQGFPALEGLGKQFPPGVNSVASAKAEATLSLFLSTSVYLLIGWPIRGHHFYRAGQVCQTSWWPHVMRADPNSCGTDPKFSIKIELAKHRRTLLFKQPRWQQILVQLAATVLAGWVCQKFEGLNIPMVKPR